MDFKRSKESVKRVESKKGFHAKYVVLSKKRNLAALTEVKEKTRNSNVLDFHCDRIKVMEWMAIFDAMKGDNTLRSVAIRLRKNREMGNFDQMKII